MLTANVKQKLTFRQALYTNPSASTAQLIMTCDGRRIRKIVSSYRGDVFINIVGKTLRRKCDCLVNDV